jgi:nucleoside-diphosphate-sugar epimerase/dTDP-glucose pyrophosphorylase
LKAIILAGGYSKRLWPITREIPKCFLEFGGKPVIDHIMEKIEQVDDIDEVIVSTNKKFEYFFVHWIGNSKYKKQIKLIVEETTENEKKLGAIGAINYVLEKAEITEDFVLIAGDNLFECTLKDFVEFFKSKNTISIAVNDVKSFERVRKLGVVELNNDKVVSFEEKPQQPKSTTICSGIYAFPKTEIETIKNYIKEGNNPDATGFLLEWMIKNNHEINGWSFEEKWFDIGTHTSFNEAKKFYQDMKGTVLVTGGLGYLGYHVIEELITAGYNIKVLDLDLYGFPPDEKYDFIKGDIRKEEDVIRAMEGVDYVVHLAALSNDPSCDVSPDKGIEINYNGTKLVAKTAKKMGIKRLVFPSSCSVYGAAEGVVSEEDKTGPLTLYAQTKLASEHYLRSLVDEKFDVGIFRFATLFGHSNQMRFDLVANIIPVEAVVDGEMKLFGGNQSRPLLHVNDAARAIVAAIQHPEPLKGEPLNGGNTEQNYTIRELTENIQKNIFPDINIKEFPDNVDARSYQVNFDKVKTVLNYETKTDIIKGVSEIAEKLKNKEYGDPRADQYFRVKHIKSQNIVL